MITAVRSFSYDHDVAKPFDTIDFCLGVPNVSLSQETSSSTEPAQHSGTLFHTYRAKNYTTEAVH